MARMRRVFRTLSVLTALLAVSGCGGGSSSSTSPSTGSPKASHQQLKAKKVTAFGDSITVGILELRRRDLGLATANNYPVLLQNKLRTFDASWVVVNRGLGGEHTVQGAARLPGVLGVDQPGIVLIMEGTNDSRKCWSPEEAVENLRAMVRAAREAGAVPFLALVPPTFSSAICRHEAVDAINAGIRANHEGAILVDMFTPLNSASLFGADHAHPNEQGYAVMAEVWFQAIQQAANAGVIVPERRRS